MSDQAGVPLRARLYSAADMSGLPMPAPSAFAKWLRRDKGRGHGHPVTILHALFPPAGGRMFRGCRRPVAKGAALARFKGLPP